MSIIRNRDSFKVLLGVAEWRWHQSRNPSSSAWLFREDSQHRKIIKWFGDNPSQISPLSIHSLVALGEATGKKAGDWYGPASVAHLLRYAYLLYDGAKKISSLTLMAYSLT
jgi:cysteine protease ATG4